MFSLQITLQSHSLHLGNSPPCLERQDRRRGEKEEREGCGSCFLKQCYKKQLKNPYYSQVVKIITFQNSFFFFPLLNKGSAPCFQVDCLQEKYPNPSLIRVPIHFYPDREVTHSSPHTQSLRWVPPSAAGSSAPSSIPVSNKGGEPCHWSPGAGRGLSRWGVHPS